MSALKERLMKLVEVKSIMTLLLTFVFTFLTVSGSLSGEQFMTIYTMIVGFYFGVQAAKHE